MADDVNYAPGEEPGCKCTKENIPTYLLIMGTVACGGVILISILDLMQFSGLDTFILDIYLVVLALLAWTAELRMFKALRSMIYTWIKFVYFLTNNVGRGLFYFFMGSIVLSDKPLPIIVGAFTIATGVAGIVLSICFKLPNYLDWQVVKEEAKAKATATKNTLEGKLNTPSNAATPKNYVPPNPSAI